VISLVRTEFTKAARRTRTLVVGALLVGLPALIVFALHQRNNVRQANAGEGLFRLARQSGLLVPAAVLGATSGFLLVVIAATFAGDSVAGDSAWGNLRYLLMRPVPRGRLLVAKATVAGLLIWVSTFLVALAGLLAGIALFGAHPVNVVAIGLQISEKTLMLRVLLSTAYVAFGFTALLALGTFFSVLTDTAGVYIVSEILDGITQLGRVRYLFPTHYLDSWQSMFTDNRYSHDMIAGVLVQVGYLVVFGTLAAVYFRRKDIRS